MRGKLLRGDNGERRSAVTFENVQLGALHPLICLVYPMLIFEK